MSRWFYLDEANNVCGPVAHFLADPRIRVGWDDDDKVRSKITPTGGHGIRPCGWERVAFTELAETCSVSTVFLGLDHSHDDTDPPIVFETVTWWGVEYREPLPEIESAGPLYEAARQSYNRLLEVRPGPVRKDWDSARYSTWAEAEAGHQAMVEKLARALAAARADTLRMMKQLGE